MFVCENRAPVIILPQITDQARQVFEQGIEVNPLYAPLYHSLAELEARVCNLEGLSKLNKRASEVFNNNVLVPPPSSTKAWGTKLKARRSRTLPKGIAALAQKIVDDEDGSDDASILFHGGDSSKENPPFDPTILLDRMSSYSMEEELIGELFGIDSIHDNNRGSNNADHIMKQEV